MLQYSIASPIGPVSAASDGKRLTAIMIGIADPPIVAPDALAREALAQLAAFFAGRLRRFDLPLAPATTPRGPAYRAAIAAIDFGETASYGAIARLLGSSPRAVGQACRRNPFPIVVPCHRVLGAGDAIGHYSAGEGIATKRWLLNHERGK